MATHKVTFNILCSHCGKRLKIVEFWACVSNSNRNIKVTPCSVCIGNAKDKTVKGLVIERTKRIFRAITKKGNNNVA
jgi:hypothetical protein